MTAADNNAVPDGTPAYIENGPDFGVIWFNGTAPGILTFNDDCNLVQVSNDRKAYVYGEEFGGIFLEEPYDVLPEEQLLVCGTGTVGSTFTLHCTAGNDIDIYQIRANDYLAIGATLHEGEDEGGYSPITLVVNYVR